MVRQGPQSGLKAGFDPAMTPTAEKILTVTRHRLFGMYSLTHRQTFVERIAHLGTTADALKRCAAAGLEACQAAGENDDREEWRFQIRLFARWFQRRAWCSGAIRGRTPRADAGRIDVLTPPPTP